MNYTEITITKVINRTYHMLWVKPKFTTFDANFIKIRKNMGDTEEDWFCFKCDKQFKTIETIGIACFREVGNKLICLDCANELDNKNVNGKFGGKKNE